MHRHNMHRHNMHRNKSGSQAAPLKPAANPTPEQEKLYFDRLLSLKNVGAQQLLANQFEYYKTWYHSAIRSILEYFDFRGDYAELADGLVDAGHEVSQLGAVVQPGDQDRHAVERERTAAIGRSLDHHGGADRMIDRREHAEHEQRRRQAGRDTAWGIAKH